MVEISSVIVGACLFLTVIYSHLWQQKAGAVRLNALLAMIAFILVGGPIWSSMTIKHTKDGEFEFSLAREAEAQMQSYVTILEQYDKILDDPRLPLDDAARSLDVSRRMVSEGIEENQRARVIEGMQNGTRLVDAVASQLRTPR